MNTLQRLGLLCAGALSMIGCVSSTEYRERQNVELAMYEEYAGAPVDRIRTFNGIDRWQSLSPSKLVVWTTVNRAWLLTLSAPCSGIEFQHTISISSTNSTVYRRFDKVEFEHQVCFIRQIHPIDYKTLKRERREKSEAERA